MGKKERAQKHQEEEYYVEDIIDYRVEGTDGQDGGGKEWFLTKWVGWPVEQATWEPIEHMKFLDDWPDYYEELKKNYQAKLEKKRLKKQKKEKKGAFKAKTPLKKDKTQRSEKVYRKTRSKPAGLAPIEEVQEKSFQNSSIFSGSEHSSESNGESSQPLSGKGQALKKKEQPEVVQSEVDPQQASPPSGPKSPQEKADQRRFLYIKKSAINPVDVRFNLKPEPTPLFLKHPIARIKRLVLAEPTTFFQVELEGMPEKKVIMERSICSRLAPEQVLEFLLSHTKVDKQGMK